MANSTSGVRCLSKVTRPQAVLVHRERVCREFLDNASPVTWLMATAGSGKTSLCIELTERAAASAAWLRVDEADRDVANFLHFLTRALKHSGADPAWQVPTLSPEHLQAPQGYIRVFLRSLAEHVQPNFVLVIDDAHHCQDSPFFGVLLERCVDELPPGARVIVASRNAPPEGCARILCHADMKVIGGDAMAFTPQEAEQLLALNGVGDRHLATAVCEYSRGWAIGIVLMGSLLKRQLGADRPIAIGELLTEVAFNYIGNEVFGMLPDEERQFLLSICYLPHFSAKAAQAISGISRGSELLERLVTSGWLVFKYEGGRFGLHDLFRKFLRDQAAQHLSDAQRHAILEQSIEQLAAEGNADEAIELAIAHQMLASAGKLIESHAASTYAATRHQTLARWIQSIAPEERSVWHNYWFGRATYAADSALARDALLRASEGFAAEGNDLYRYSCVALVISSYSFNGAGPDSIQDILRRHVDIGDYDRIQSAEARGQFAFAIFAALLVTQPGHQDFALWESRTLEALDNGGDKWIAIRMFTWLSIHYFFSGNYKRIQALGIRAQRLTSYTDLPPYARYLSFFGLLFIPMVGDRLALERTYKDAVQVGDATGFRNMDGHYALNYAVGLLLDGKSDDCEQLLASIAAATPPGHFNLLGHLNSVRAWAANWRGDTVAAREYADLGRQAGRKFHSVPYEVWGAVSDAVGDALSGSAELPSSVALLRQLAASANYPLALIHADLLEAWYWLRCGQRDKACLFLGEGFTLLGKSSEGYLTSAVPQILQPLCCLAFDAGIGAAIAAKVVNTFSIKPPKNAGARWPWPVSIRCFGSFALFIDGEQPKSTGKSKFRQLDLLKYLAICAPQPIPLLKVADALWPDAEGDAARSSLDTNLARLRKLIGKESICVENGTIWLDLERCHSDTRVIDEVLNLLDAGSGVLSPVVVERFVSHFCGDLLAGEEIGWIYPLRERWHNRIVRVLGSYVANSMKLGERSSVIVIVERVLEVWPHSERFTRLLMQLLVEQGALAGAMDAYNRFCSTLPAGSGGSASIELNMLVTTLRKRIDNPESPNEL